MRDRVLDGFPAGVTSRQACSHALPIQTILKLDRRRPPLGMAAGGLASCGYNGPAQSDLVGSARRQKGLSGPAKVQLQTLVEPL